MLLHVLDLVGVSVFAVSGALAAGRRGLDLVGVLVLGIVTAIGGGTIRDVLLDRHPIFWLADPAYLALIIFFSLATVAYVRRWPPPRAALLVADGLGLALFSVAGAQIAEVAGLPALSGILLGTVTGTAGGAVRDILTAEVPLILRQGNPYASAAIAGTGMYFLLQAGGIPRSVSSLAGMGVCVAIRFAGIWWGLQVPVFVLGEDDKPTRPRT